MFFKGRLANLRETAVSLLFFCIADCALWGYAPQPQGKPAVFFMVLTQSKHQQVLHFDFESSL